ncbi:MAG: hypothetical protein WDW38_005106 [Sanguina aurantia]
MAGPPPGTAMRGPGGAGPPPSSAYKRTGTANNQRPGTQSSANGPAGVRTGTSVTVDSRPITNHGLTGVKPGGGGGGRQVLDKTYFVNELRQKRTEVANKTAEMRSELDALEKRQSQFNSMDRRCNDLMKEVKLLQEALADYNTVLDKVGSQTPVHLITAEYVGLRERNEQSRKRVEDIVSERLQLEAKVKQTDQKMGGIQRSMDERLAAMPPSQRSQYSDLTSEQATLQQEGKRMEEACEELDRTLAVAEGELARNPLKLKALQLQEQIRSLTERKYELQQEEEKSRLSPEEQREAIMGKTKRDSQEVEGMTAQVRDVQEQVKRMEARLSAAGPQGSTNAAEEASRREKFDELLVKERVINDFMDVFPSSKAVKVTERQSKEDAVVALLERITKLSSLSSSALPSQKKFKEMQDELEYKRMQLENTQSTQISLEKLETKLRTATSNIYSMDDFIKDKESETNYKSLAVNIMSLADELNGTVKRAIA